MEMGLGPRSVRWGFNDGFTHANGGSDLTKEWGQDLSDKVSGLRDLVCCNLYEMH